MQLKANKPRRFFFHFNRHLGKMSVHFMGKCHIVDDIVCNAPCETKKNKKQPRLVMRGYASVLEINDKIGILL